MEGDKVYMAPEALEGQANSATDIFSLGLIILELAADVVLPDDGELWHSLRVGDFVDIDLSGVSPELRTCIMSMLHPNPMNRPSSTDLIRLCM